MHYNQLGEQGDTELFQFLANAPKEFREGERIRKYQLKNGDYIHCILWNMHFYITGTDIVKILVWRFQNAGRHITSHKKFEEGVFSDLRNLKPGIDAILESPRSDFLEFLYKNGCIRTQKKQKVFFWYSVPHDALFCDALERDLRRETNLYTYSKYMYGMPGGPRPQAFMPQKRALKTYIRDAKAEEKKTYPAPKPVEISEKPTSDMTIDLFKDSHLPNPSPFTADSSYTSHIQKFIQPSKKTTGMEYNFNELDLFAEDSAFIESIVGESFSFSQPFEKALIFDAGCSDKKPDLEEFSFVNPKKLTSGSGSSCQRG
ncbi:transcription factor STE12 [Nematocida homosporus]|uniref:transcription factor STE12 n=1 Tax=Nematocida homosporus TaxID=1912981 RepID=UPI0022210C5C|nr:transcription factor STE12 [Nematocida homosporus]KAI5187840.1 transcription factor STE12 [Nematocida homosporus]